MPPSLIPGISTEFILTSTPAAVSLRTPSAGGQSGSPRLPGRSSVRRRATARHRFARRYRHPGIDGHRGRDPRSTSSRRSTASGSISPLVDRHDLRSGSWSRTSSRVRKGAGHIGQRIAGPGYADHRQLRDGLGHLAHFQHRSPLWGQQRR